jgi:hypothetical protein
MAEITGVLSVNNALIPQDIEVIPSNEDITLTADEGFYIRSVTVKAIPSDNSEGGNDNNDNNGTDSGD